ncbi:hypothetical protein Ancab_028099 [Ancistrocladus abbreviatus]
MEDLCLMTHKFANFIIKVLIGADGVNSEVAKWLGFKKPSFAPRYAIRGYADYKESHRFEHKFLQFFVKGFRGGVVPCNDTSFYWFICWHCPTRDKEMEDNPEKMKEFVLNKFDKVPDKVKDVFKITNQDDLVCSQLRYRAPWEILRADISRDNVCVAGDALHPMTPDLGQGACSALEDSVILARCLAEAFAKNSTGEKCSEEEEHERIKMSLKEYAKERRWRAFDLVSTAYIVGGIQLGNEKVIRLLRDKFLAPYLAKVLMKKASYNCGPLESGNWVMQS